MIASYSEFLGYFQVQRLHQNLNTFRTNSVPFSLKGSSHKKNVFPIAAVTNYNKLGGLKQHKFILSSSSGGQKSKMSFTELKLGVGRISFLLWALAGEWGDLFFAFSIF